MKFIDKWCQFSRDFTLLSFRMMRRNGVGYPACDEQLSCRFWLTYISHRHIMKQFWNNFKYSDRVLIFRFIAYKMERTGSCLVLLWNSGLPKVPILALFQNCVDNESLEDLVHTHTSASRIIIYFHSKRELLRIGLLRWDNNISARRWTRIDPWLWHYCISKRNQQTNDGKYVHLYNSDEILRKLYYEYWGQEK